jgi:hypothetical protein
VDREIDRLDSFFETYFHDDTFFTRAINIYSTLGEFEEKLTIALRSYIIGRIPVSPSKIAAKNRPTYNRQPYLGLASFDYEDAPVFFGRTAQIGEIITAYQSQELEAQSNPDAAPKHFTLILGSSGSGKSSLARAGVLPMLTNPGVIEGANAWRTAHGDFQTGGHIRRSHTGVGELAQLAPRPAGAFCRWSQAQGAGGSDPRATPGRGPAAAAGADPGGRTGACQPEDRNRGKAEARPIRKPRGGREVAAGGNRHA